MRYALEACSSSPACWAFGRRSQGIGCSALAPGRRRARPPGPGTGRGGAGGPPCGPLGVYITDVAHWPEVDAACAAHFGPHRPARTILTCPSLHHDSLVEIDAIAAFPEPAP
ncbi:RidA family protein [Roseococcus sp. YIM B11640]|uniref:RidA family protein n=1 Tax=Roseococcus sp. YIM B11640 TaxID=3133973 RepID=UPI003C7BC693